MEEYLIKKPCIMCKKDAIHNIATNLGIVRFCSDECMKIHHDELPTHEKEKKDEKLKIVEVKVVPDRRLYPASRMAMDDGNNHDET